MHGKGHRAKIHICGTPSRERTDAGVQHNAYEWNQATTWERQKQLSRRALRGPMVIQDHTPH